jgi:MFS family permease
VAGSPILTPAFLTAGAANLLFFTGAAAFVLLPLHARALGAGDGQVGLIMGAYTGAAIVLQPLVGAWVDRAGRRAFLVSGAALTAVSALLFAAAPDALRLFPLLRALQGIGFAVFFVANFALVVDLVPRERRGQALGIFGISGLTSTALGPALGEALVQAAGFRGLFLAVAGTALAAAAISATLAVPAPGLAPAGQGGLAGLLRGAAAAPRLPLSLGSAFGLGTGVIFTYFPTYAADLGLARVGVFAIAYSVAALAVRAGAGQVADRAGRRTVIIPAMVLQALAAVVLAALGPLATGAGWRPGPLLVLAGLLAGTGHGFLYPALTALVVDVTPPDRRGRVVGVFSAAILVGQTGGAVCFGPIAHALGYAGMFGVLAVTLGAGCALALRLPR